MTLWTLLACGSEAPPPPPPATPPPVAVEPAPNPHASHGEHMAQMAATRETLRTTLGEAYDAPVPGLAEADATAGRAVYDAHCASCHGASGKGDGEAGKGTNPPPADFTDAFHARYYSDAGRVHLVRTGSPGTAMVGFEETLAPPQILDVYAYVLTFRAPATP